MASGEEAVDLLAAYALPALPGLDDRLLAQPLDEVKAHVRDGGAAVQTAFRLHLLNDMLQHLLLVLVQRQLPEDKGVALNSLGGGKAHRQTGLLGMVLDKMHHRVDTAVNGAAVVVLVAEVLLQRRLLIPGDVNGVAHQLVHALVFGGGDGDHRHAQHGLHGVDVDGALIAHQLIHHVQCHHRGNIHLQKLHGQVQVPLDVGGVYDVDDSLGLILQDKVPGYDLLAAEGRHGVDARQVCDLRIGIAPDDAGLSIHRDAGEVAHMLL